MRARMVVGTEIVFRNSWKASASQSSRGRPPVHDDLAGPVYAARLDGSKPSVVLSPGKSHRTPTPTLLEVVPDMKYDKPVSRLAIVGGGGGTGVIGAKLGAQYLDRGFEVVATDPGPDAEARAAQVRRRRVARAPAIGWSTGASRERIGFTTEWRGAVAGDLVQEKLAPSAPMSRSSSSPTGTRRRRGSLNRSSSSGHNDEVMHSKHAPRRA